MNMQISVRITDSNNIIMIFTACIKQSSIAIQVVVNIGNHKISTMINVFIGTLCINTHTEHRSTEMQYVSNM